MIAELTNHVWQSTLFAIAVALLTLAFRKNRAAVRYGLWFAASCKFLIPFALLMSFGSRFERPAVERTSRTPSVGISMVQIAQPFSKALPSLPSGPSTTTNWTPVVIFGVWLGGFIVIALMRLRGWRLVRAAVLASTRSIVPAAVEVRSSPGLLEPGVVGLLRPVLLLPADIVERLTPAQLDTVLAHELCHIQRRDNLTSAAHMLVETVFWFHPIVWWIGARLLEERERACDEAVLSLGSEPHDYAEGILNVCKSYLESPLTCVPGVTGSNLKNRLRAILTGRIPGGLSLPKKMTLGIAGMTALLAPVAIGLMNAPVRLALSPNGPVPKFAVASITPCEAFRRRQVPFTPGRLQSGCTTVERFIERAYGLFSNGHENVLSSVTVSGGPAWTNSDLYEIDAKADGESQSMMDGPMLQALLEDKLKLKIHRETREVPVYELTLAKGGSKLRPFEGTCISWYSDEPTAHYDPKQMCGRVVHVTSSGFDFEAASMVDICMFLKVTLDLPIIDKTGITGRYDLHLDVPTSVLRNRGLSAFSNPATPAPAMGPSFIAAAEAGVGKLGLNLEPSRRPGEFIIIDSVERP